MIINEIRIFPQENFKEKCRVIGGPCPAVSSKSFKLKVSSAWMALYSVYRIGEKHQVRNFLLAGSTEDC